MSQQQWQPSPRSGGGGSVRRARERMEEGLPPETSQPPQQRSYQQPRVMQGPPGSRSRPQMPAAMNGGRNGQGQPGIAISRPTQVPQWPLAGSPETNHDSRNPQYQPPPGRGAPPQRPPRPSHVPSMLDASRLQEHTPTFQYQLALDSPEQHIRGRYQEEDILSPGTISSSVTASSRRSDISSVGTIPDFPVPMNPQPAQQGPPRRSLNIGPPPSSRRGASSYYSQVSFVSPIPEESPRTQVSHQSYASSAAMPSHWESESPGYRSDEMDDYYERERGFEGGIIEEGRESRGSNGDDREDRGLIRSASLGKRAKPSMITTKSSDKITMVGTSRPDATPLQKQSSKSKLERMGVIEGMSVGASVAVVKSALNAKDGQRQTVWPTIGNADSPLAGGTGLIDKTPSSTSEESIPRIAQVQPPADAPMPSSTDPGANPILAAYNSASSLQPGATPTRTPSPGFSRLSAIRRPPRLDIDAVRDAEARGSLTSLPDLIRRATKLAALMDRGKRPGSRMNDLSDFPSEIDLSSRNKAFSPDSKRQSGLSDMLSAFPPPGLGTPREENSRPMSSWPSPFAQDKYEKDPNAKKQKKSGRRCCGLPCWGFLLLMFILLIIMAAAVVIPLEFLVFRKNRESTSTPSALQQCQLDTVTACQNNGMSSVATGPCSCICVNGFTGSTCSVPDQGACTTINLQDSSVSNATLGDAISRLISSAQTNFSIPLSEQVIIARFNAADLSCVSQNALVTFDGQPQRVGEANAVVIPKTTASSSSSATRTPNARLRLRQDTTTSSVYPAATANGILYDPSTFNSTPTSSGATPSSPAVFNVTQERLDFARVAVLFVLQQETLDNAIAAQSSLQILFGMASLTTEAALNVSLGNGNHINLVDFKLDVGNGTIGGTNSSTMKRSLGLPSFQLSWYPHK